MVESRNEVCAVEGLSGDGDVKSSCISFGVFFLREYSSLACWCSEMGLFYSATTCVGDF
jgi:hypothetical protein